jgi:hypothetical protein
MAMHERGQLFHPVASARTVLLVVGIGVLVIVCTGTAALVIAPRIGRRSAATATPAPTQTPVPPVAPTHANLATPQAACSDLATYLAQPHVAAWLGTAISPEVAEDEGEEQFFTNAVIARHGSASAPVAVVPALINGGAAIPLGPASSSLIYAALAPATGAAGQAPPPWWWNPATDPTVDGIFIAESARGNQEVGYLIPAQFVPFLLALGHWQRLLGDPITAVQATTARINGATHVIAIQAFANGVLWYDRSAPGKIAVHMQPVGRDDLAMFGYPSFTIPANRPAWTTTALTVATGPGASTGNATFLTPFAVLLAGDVHWVGHVLWYHIRWRNVAETRDGWVPSTDLALEQPHALGQQIADLDALSPQLWADANAYDANVTMAIYDPQSQHYYVYNPYEGLEMASMFKVPILVTLLHSAEVQGRSLTADEQAEAASMIEVSDNVAEVTLYDDAGGFWGVTDYLASIGITDLYINTSGIGSTLLSPLSAVKLMEDLRTARILTPADCRYALYLMAHVISYQQVGVADSAPPGAAWAMKIGYGPGMDTLWLMDSMGTVTYNGHSYDLAILSRNSQDFASGAALVDHLCDEAVQAMVGVP